MTDWQKDKQTNRRTSRMTDRQTSLTESQTGKMVGRNKARQYSNMQISGMKERLAGKTAGILLGRTAIDKTGRGDGQRKMGADDRLAERQTVQ